MSRSPISPPKLPTRFLLWFLRDDLAEEVVGDLEEKFELAVEKGSVWSARLNYWYQVIHYLRPFAIGRRRHQPKFYNMYSNYIKVSIRSFLRGKMHASINLMGLTIAMVVVILLFLWEWDELSFDRYNDNYDRVAQVLQNVTNNGEIQTWNNVPFPLAEELRKNYHEDLEQIVMGTNMWEHTIEFDNRKIYKHGIFFEKGATELFSLNIIAGTDETAKDQTAMLLSASAAKAIFGDEDPIGKILLVDDDMELKVTGIYEDLPHNARLRDMEFVGSYDFFHDHSGWMNYTGDPWRPNAFLLFVKLAENASFIGVSEKIKDAKLKKLSEALALKKPELFLHPMSKWHLYSEFDNGVNTGGRIRYVWLFGMIGAFVLVMACINFMNLSTARSEKRSREIGIRKAVGSLRTQLLGQFFTESILLALMSFILALGIAYLVMPYFNQVADKKLELFVSAPMFWLLSIGFILITGFLAGSYPALYLSSIRSIQALKGTFKPGRAASTPRKVLVVLQFVVSICLITGTIIVFQQIEFARNRPVGYNREGLLMVPINSTEMANRVDAIKEELLASGMISEMARSQNLLTSIGATTSGFSWTGKDPGLSVDFPFSSVSYDYGKTIDWEMVAGRDFSRDFPSDSSGVILNEAAVRYIGFKDPVGEPVKWFDNSYKVIGVVKDVVSDSPYEPVRPHIYFLSTSGYVAVLRIDPSHSVGEALRVIESTFKKHNPGEVFDFQFVGDNYARKFNSEERVGNLAGLFSLLAIFISCLGIFGLSSFVAEQRTKEIGIRKVNGASLFSLWKLLTTDFVILVVMSGLISIPVSVYLASSWLENFSYRADPVWWVYVVSIAGALLITLATVSYHTISAARTNPVKCLRTE